jgi:hypothetical protein
VQDSGNRFDEGGSSDALLRVDKLALAELIARRDSGALANAVRRVLKETGDPDKYSAHGSSPVT